MPYAVIGLAVIVGAVLFAQIVYGFPPRTLPRQAQCRHPSYATDAEADAALVVRTGRGYQQEGAEE